MVIFRGSCVALVTPFKNNEIDKKTLTDLVEYHIDNGTDAILPCGTTGESATLTYEEHIEVVKIVVEAVKGRVPVIAGTGSNSTRETYDLTKHVRDVGVDAVLLVAPYYNKPTQKGLYEHYAFIAKNIDIPIIIYNIPGRTGVNIAPETIISLAREYKNIIAVKEASGNINQVSELIRGTDEDNFFVYSGDDSLTLPMLSVGAKGVISVIANIAPRDTHNLCEYWFRGDIENAKKMHLKMFPLVKALFIETNPIPVKTAMGMLKLCSDELRLPLTSMEEKNKNKLQQAIKEYGLI